MVMADVNGITKSNHAIMVSAQFHVFTLYSPIGLNVHSLVSLLHIVLKIVCVNIVHRTVSLAMEMIVLLSLRTKEIVIHILTSVIKCASLVHGVHGLIAVLNMVGANVFANDPSLNTQLVMKFAHNCTKLTDAITSLLQTTALGVLGLIGVNAMQLAVLHLPFLSATGSAT
jgi:hypothetical protein